MTGKANDDEDAVAEEAAAWFLRQRAAPGDAVLRAGFSAWLARSEAHARAYRMVERAWQLSGDVPPAHADRWAGRARPAAMPLAAAARPRFRRRRYGLALAAALAACLLFALLPTLRMRLEADIVVGTAGSRQLTLADGSMVTLGAETAIAVDFTPTERVVRLLSGSGLFTVAADPARPFSVTAAGLRATALGTAFEVDLGATLLSVGVQKGVVQVVYGQGAQRVETRATPGDLLKIDRKRGTVQRDSVPAELIGAWRTGQLVVNQATIAEVVEQVRRYHHGVIVVSDDSLAASRVSGVFDLHDPLAALRAAVAPHAGTVHALTPYLLVISAR